METFHLFAKPFFLFSVAILHMPGMKSWLRMLKKERCDVQGKHLRILPDVSWCLRHFCSFRFIASLVHTIVVIWIRLMRYKFVLESWVCRCFFSSVVSRFCFSVAFLFLPYGCVCAVFYFLNYNLAFFPKRHQGHCRFFFISAHNNHYFVSVECGKKQR